MTLLQKSLVLMTKNINMSLTYAMQIVS